jgi:hypothetical protein
MNDDALSKMYSKTMPEKIFGHNFEMTCFKITIRYKKITTRYFILPAIIALKR